MNLNQLEYFVSVAENLNFTKAAAQCFVSQTAMTQQIQNLEKTIGVPLFVRDKHHVSLTPAGEVYLKEAKTILRRSDDAIRLARMASDQANGEIKIGFISGFGQTDCIQILRGFHEAFPNINVKLVRDTMSGLMHSLSRGDCDLVFTVQPHQREYENLNHLYINSYSTVVALEQGHRLSGEKSIHCSLLEKEKFIIMQPPGRSRDEMEEMLWVYQRGGFLPNVVAIENEPETIMLMVSLGIGVCILPEYVTRIYQKNPDICFIPLVKDDMSAETLAFEMLWSGSNQNSALDKLINWWSHR